MTRIFKLIIIAAALLGGMGLLGYVVTRDMKAPKSYTPSEVQLLRLQVKQRDAQIAQQSLMVAQQNFQAKLTALTEEAERVKAENKWDPKDVSFNPDTLKFDAIAALAGPPVPAKPNGSAASQPPAKPTGGRK